MHVCTPQFRGEVSRVLAMSHEVYAARGTPTRRRLANRLISRLLCAPVVVDVSVAFDQTHASNGFELAKPLAPPSLEFGPRLEAPEEERVRRAIHDHGRCTWIGADEDREFGAEDEDAGTDTPSTTVTIAPTYELTRQPADLASLVVSAFGWSARSTPALASRAFIESPSGVHVIAALRRPGESMFSERDIEALDLAHEAMLWLARDSIAEAGDGSEVVFDDDVPRIIGERVPARMASPGMLPAEHPLLCSLTKTQLAVLPMLLEGLSEAEIAKRVHRSIHTVHDHAKAIYQKIGVRTRAQLVARFLREQREAARMLPTSKPETVASQSGMRE